MIIKKLQDALTADKKAKLVDALNLYMVNNRNAKLRMVLHKFEQNSRISTVQSRFFKRLLATKAGLFVLSF